jgi:adenylate cyclase
MRQSQAWSEHRVALEFERKFLVAGESWRDGCVGKDLLVDGLLATSKGRKVRVRINGPEATVCIKSRKSARVRDEFEYPIPLADARQLLENDCGGDVVAKTRHYVPHAGFTWEVDVYEGALAGIVIAEIELPSEDTQPPLPPWIGREVTDDPQFRKRVFRARGLLKATRRSPERAKLLARMSGDAASAA